MRYTLAEKLLEINVAKYQRKIPSLTEVGALQICSYCKATLITLMRDVPLTVENM